MIVLLVCAALLVVAVATWRLMRKEDLAGRQSSDPTTKADWMRSNF